MYLIIVLLFYCFYCFIVTKQSWPYIYIHTCIYNQSKLPAARFRSGPSERHFKASKDPHAVSAQTRYAGDPLG